MVPRLCTWHEWVPARVLLRHSLMSIEHLRCTPSAAAAGGRGGPLLPAAAVVDMQTNDGSRLVSQRCWACRAAALLEAGRLSTSRTKMVTLRADVLAQGAYKVREAPAAHLEIPNNATIATPTRDRVTLMGCDHRDEAVKLTVTAASTSPGLLPQPAAGEAPRAHATGRQGRGATNMERSGGAEASG